MLSKRKVLSLSILSLFLLSGCLSDDDKTSKTPSGTSAQEQLAKRELKMLDEAKAKKEENRRKLYENTDNPARGMLK